MEQRTTGIHHVAIMASGVEDYEKTIKFYHEILGMPITKTWGEGKGTAAMLDTGCGFMEIFACADGYPGQGALRHLAFSVKDVDACVEAVRAAGYEITKEAKDVDIPCNPPYPVRAAFCIGPVGEEIEFFAER